MANVDSIQRLVRSRFARLALASSLIALSAWAFLPYLAYRVAPSAFVNAELVRVTAPIAGRLTLDLPRKGDFIDHTTTVPLVESLARDRRHLMDLSRQVAAASERSTLARRQLAEIAVIDRELASRTEAYRSGVVTRLGHEIDEATAERSGCLAEVEQRREIGARMTQLVQSGIVSKIRAAEALAIQEAVSTRCEMANARLQRLKLELGSAQNGVFFRDGANDVPYSQQQRDRLLLRRQELESQVLEENSRAAQIATEIVEENSRLDRLWRYEVVLPATHVVWSVAASPGSAVMEGQFVFDLANCGSRFVAVELPEREFEKIKAGAFANVRLIGSNHWIRGEVRQVRGSAARADDRLLAAQVPKPGAGNITVEVALPAEESPPDHNSFCNVGRLAEVRFQRAHFGFFATLSKQLEWLSGTTEGPVAVNVGK